MKERVKALRSSWRKLIDFLCFLHCFPLPVCFLLIFLLISHHLFFLFPSHARVSCFCWSCISRLSFPSRVVYGFRWEGKRRRRTFPGKTMWQRVSFSRYQRQEMWGKTQITVEWVRETNLIICLFKCFFSFSSHMNSSMKLHSCPSWLLLFFISRIPEEK